MMTATTATARSDQTTVRVAFQGELGAFSEGAVLAFFGSAAEPQPQKQFADVAAAVRSRAAEYGLLPIENTTVGGVAAACDVLRDAELYVVGEVVCAVRHCVLALPGTQFGDVRRALSHPVALGQCTNFFLRHPEIEPLATYDTAGAAKQVAQSNDRNTVAIAARRAADRYGLVVLQEDIQDRDDNQTRFLVLSPAAQAPTVSSAECKTALLLETANRPGALVRALSPFADRGINLTHLQSRPARDPWRYWFFMEVQGSTTDADLAAALGALERESTSVRVLGSFPRWIAGVG
jgi:prephenate dehydratase